jgi:hypothetical protein
VDLRISARALVVGPLVYLLGMIVAGILGANFLETWFFGVLIFALVVGAWASRDAAARGIDTPQLWGLAAGFIPLAGIALYLMRRAACSRAL